MNSNFKRSIKVPLGRREGYKYLSLKISVVYLAVGLLWILFSDNLAALISQNKDMLSTISKFKGWFYVIITSSLLYILLLRTFKKIEVAERKLSKSYEELTSAHEELIANEEELRANYLELEKSQIIIAQNEERYRLAVEGSNDIIWDWDIISDELYLSDKWDALSGYTDKNILNKTNNWNDIIYPEDREAHKRALDAYFTEKGPFFQHTYRIITADGRIKWILDRGAAIFDRHNKPVRMAGSLTDITERVYYDEEIKRAKDEAEKANEAKSIFLANMSHELRTPMNGIIGPTDIMLSSCDDLEQRGLLNMIKISASHLLEIISDVLDISKIEAGNMKLENQSFSLKSLLSDIYNTHIINAKQKELGFEFINEGEIPENVIGDETRLKQILNNLLSNAFKFTSSGSVAVILRKISEDAVKIKLEFEVKDSGIGIKEEDIKRLFNRFTQLDYSYGKQFGGTGLGLSICKELVNMMGGTLWVKSAYGVGSSFFFQIELER